MADASHPCPNTGSGYTIVADPGTNTCPGPGPGLAAADTGANTGLGRPGNAVLADAGT